MAFGLLSSPFYFLGQIRLRVRTLDKATQSGLDGRAREEIDEDLDLLSQFIVRYRFHEPFGCVDRRPIELADLRGGEARDLGRLSFRRQLADKPNRLGLRRVDASSGQEKIADDTISEIPLQTWNSSKSWNQSEPQLREAEARQLLGEDQVARQRQLKPSTERHAIDSGNCDQG